MRKNIFYRFYYLKKLNYWRYIDLYINSYCTIKIYNVLLTILFVIFVSSKIMNVFYSKKVTFCLILNLTTLNAFISSLKPLNEQQVLILMVSLYIFPF